MFSICRSISLIKGLFGVRNECGLLGIGTRLAVCPWWWWCWSIWLSVCRQAYVPQTDVMSQSLSVSESCSMYVVNMSVAELVIWENSQIWMLLAHAWCYLCNILNDSQAGVTNACCTGEMMDLWVYWGWHTQHHWCNGGTKYGCAWSHIWLFDGGSGDSGNIINWCRNFFDWNCSGGRVQCGSDWDVLAAFALDIDGGHTKKAKARCGLVSPHWWRDSELAALHGEGNSYLVRMSRGRGDQQVMSGLCSF